MGLQDATEQLYVVFARYPRPARTEGCPCCVSADDQARLHRAPLRELSDEDLSLFARKALTTWGTEDDLRHYLPRLLELIWELPVNPEVVLGKLPYGGWERWPADERDALQRWLDAFWLDSLRSDAWRAPQALNSLLCAGCDLDALLSTFEAEVEAQPVAREVALELMSNLAYHPEPIWISQHSWDAIARWLAARVPVLERALGAAEVGERPRLREELDAFLLRVGTLEAVPRSEAAAAPPVTPCGVNLFESPTGLRYRLTARWSSSFREQKVFLVREQARVVLFEPRSPYAFEATSPWTARSWERDGATWKRATYEIGPNDLELCSGLLDDASLAAFAARRETRPSAPTDETGAPLRSGEDYVDQSSFFFRVVRPTVREVWLAYETSSVRHGHATVFEMAKSEWRQWERVPSSGELKDASERSEPRTLRRLASLPGLRSLFDCIARHGA